VAKPFHFVTVAGIFLLPQHRFGLGGSRLLDIIAVAGGGRTKITTPSSH